MIVNLRELLKLAPITRMAQKKLKAASGTSCGLTEAGYDLRIQQEITFYPLFWGLLPLIKVVDGTKTKWSFGRFTLASATDHFRMPPLLVGVVHDKSTWARKGLSVFNTVIEPGWAGYLTLELAFKGNNKVTIKKDSGICQVLFHQISTPAAYGGKYQDQPAMPVEAIDSD